VKIGFISADWSNIEDPETGHPTPGGAGWYRMALPSQYLSRNGIETVYCELVSIDKKSHDRGMWLHDFDGNTHDDCDIIVVQRWMDENAADVLHHARLSGQVVVNDIDDWYWGLSPKNAAYKASDPRFNKKVNRDHYRRAIAASSALTVSTPFLRDNLSTPDTPAYLIRNGIDLDRWTYREPQDTPFPVVGWVGSTTHRSGDLETLKGILNQVCKRMDATFMHAGKFGDSPHAGDLAGVPEDLWMTEDGVSILEYPRLFDSIDIGIVPLSYINFNYAKSAIKGMEYAAAGIPFVAAATPEYVWLKEEIGIGNVAKKPKQWISQLQERLRQAQSAREALKVLDMSNRWGEWLEVYESLL
jgi:glycosyltransferase involved in cell wall biosynthesis